ncbi:Uu.00g108480.m01.CDS01 [Anthostomella pinea]|uniref:Uu.00g108480.m01.CDS01 n=1 Tax=Anthostomella pinea TaxID=933095 RepID=A0AAI8VF08_9PEZI|nr:Uu.00g108480.m01.CDS01 [Anthostomella pinea]
MGAEERALVLDVADVADLTDLPQLDDELHLGTPTNIPAVERAQTSSFIPPAKCLPLPTDFLSLSAAVQTPAVATNPSPQSISQDAPTRGQTKRRKKRSAQADLVEEISAPLSVLAKDLSHIEDVDIEKFVHHGTEERMKENEQTGKVKQPLNSFMLYRKAFQNRAYELLKSLNLGDHWQQRVSTVCGTSWAMEPAQLREWFRQMAQVDKQYHKLAFPSYRNPARIPDPESKPAKVREFLETQERVDWAWEYLEAKRVAKKVTQDTLLAALVGSAARERCKTGKRSMMTDGALSPRHKMISRAAKQRGFSGPCDNFRLRVNVHMSLAPLLQLL